jgi:hypothetical protein
MPTMAGGAYGGRMSRVPAIAVVLAALAVTACGESSEEKAQTTVCNSRDDISKQVGDLKALTPSTFTTDAVSKSLSSIKNDLSAMKGAQSDLADDRRQQVESANQAFTAAVDDVVKQVGTSVTAQDAASTITSSLQQLASSYEQAFSRVDCS